MEDQEKNSLSLDEIDIFQEIMNIAFSWASANLAEVLNIYVVLSVPEIKLMPVDGLPRYMAEQIKGLEAISVVEQAFWGKFMGYSYLVFPSGTERELLTIMGQSDENISEADSMASLERETLLEVEKNLSAPVWGRLLSCCMTW